MAIKPKTYTRFSQGLLKSLGEEGSLFPFRAECRRVSRDLLGSCCVKQTTAMIFQARVVYFLPGRFADRPGIGKTTPCANGDFQVYVVLATGSE